MALSTFSLGGQPSGGAAGTERDLFLKVFSGEVLAAYKKNLVVSPLVRNRTIQSGKTAQFPITGRSNAVIHAVGTNILTENGLEVSNGGAAAGLMTKITANERTIHIDDKIISATFIDELDEAMSHYDYRSPFSAELGLALAYAREKLLLRIMNKGSAVAALPPHPAGGGAINIGVGGVFTTAEFIAGAYQAAEELDDGHVSPEDRVIAVTPNIWWQLVQSTILQDKDYGGYGKMPEGIVIKIAGMQIIKSTILKELVVEDVAAGAAFGTIAGLHNDYDGSDFTGVLAIVFHKSAVGTLTLRGLSMQMEYKTEYQGDLLLARMAMGNGYLRPDAIKLITAI